MSPVTRVLGAMAWRLELPTCFIVMLLIPMTRPVRLWKTLHMDKDTQCSGFVHNDDMEEGDAYMVKSDSWEGGSPEERRPAECAMGFNFGDRYISVRLVQWICNEKFKDPFLIVYDDCPTRKANMHANILARYNCSVSIPTVTYSSGACISLYHYRGHIRHGYFFALEISARHEIIAFPAGGIAAIIVGSIVLVLILIKVICAISKWEERLPDIRSIQEDQKHMLEAEEALEPGRGDEPPPDSILIEPEKFSDIHLSSLNHEGEETLQSAYDNLSSSEDDVASGDYDNLSISWRDKQYLTKDGHAWTSYDT